MRRRLDVDVARQSRIVVDEDAVPGDAHVLEDDHRIRFVEAVGEGVVELDPLRRAERPARPERDAGRVDRHRAGHRFLYLARRERDDVADPELVGEHRAGRQHLHPVEDHALAVLRRHPQRRRAPVGALVEVRLARALRRQDRVGEVEVARARVLVIGGDALRIGAAVAVEYRRPDGQPGDRGRHMVGRAAQEPVREPGDGAVRRGADLEVPAAARFQEIGRDALAAILDPEHVAHVVGALEVVHRGVHPRGIGEGRVVGDVAHTLLADIDRPPVADACEIVFTRAQHRPRPAGLSVPDGRTRPAPRSVRSRDRSEAVLRDQRQQFQRSPPGPLFAPLPLAY